MNFLAQLAFKLSAPDHAALNNLGEQGLSLALGVHQ
jgi:hypothetical protein